MNEKENLLCDLESDIDGDWGDIQKSIQGKKREKELQAEMDYLRENPIRINFPEFHEFYELLFEIYESYYDENIAHSRMHMLIRELIGRIISQHGKEPRMCPSFDYIWGMFCNPHKYHFHTMECHSCRNTWDIAMKTKRINYDYGYHQRDMEYNMSRNMYINRVSCPLCREVIGSTGEEVVGIFKHVEIPREKIINEKFLREYLMEERGYDFR